MRPLAILVMLACAGVPPASASTLVAGALSSGIHASDHEHSVSLRPDGDHFDVVLSHAGGEPGDPHRSREDDVGVLQADHVVHVTTGQLVPSTFRRSLAAAAAVPGGSLAWPVAAPAVRIPSPARAVRASGVDHLRTVVLRL